MQLIWELSATVVSAWWTTVDCSWPKERNCCLRGALQSIKKGTQVGNESVNFPKKILACEEKSHYLSGSWHNHDKQTRECSLSLYRAAETHWGQDRHVRKLGKGRGLHGAVRDDRWVLLHGILNMQYWTNIQSSTNIQCHRHYNGYHAHQWWNYKPPFLQLPSLQGVHRFLFHQGNGY